jgi:hypothetical protein
VLAATHQQGMTVIKQMSLTSLVLQVTAMLQMWEIAQFLWTNVLGSQVQTTDMHQVASLLLMLLTSLVLQVTAMPRIQAI